MTFSETDAVKIGVKYIAEYLVFSKLNAWCLRVGSLSEPQYQNWATIDMNENYLIYAIQVMGFLARHDDKDKRKYIAKMFKFRYSLDDRTKTDLEGRKVSYSCMPVHVLTSTHHKHNMHTHMHTHMHTLTHVHMSTCTHVHMSTCTHVCMGVYMRPCGHMRACGHAYAHAQAYAHTCTHMLHTTCNAMAHTTCHAMVHTPPHAPHHTTPHTYIHTFWCFVFRNYLRIIMGQWEIFGFH